MVILNNDSLDTGILAQLLPLDAIATLLIETCQYLHMWVSMVIGVTPIAQCFMMENPVRIDYLGVQLI